MKTTQKALRELVKYGDAVDITSATGKDREIILENEGSLSKIAYSHGRNGLNGLLLKGHNTKELYAITDRSTAIFIFA